MGQQGPSEREAGFALLSAVWGLGILLVLTSSLIAISRSGVRASSLQLEHSQARAFDDAILLEVVARLQNKDVDRRPRVDGVPMTITVMGQPATIQVQDEFGKVDLNAAPTETLSSLFVSGGLSPGAADKLAADVDAWRRSRDPSQGLGLGNVHIFEAASELLLMPGMTEGLYSRIEPALTVYSGQEKIETAVAPYEALLTLTGMVSGEALKIVADRQSGSRSINPLSSVVNGRIPVGVDQRGWPLRVTASFQSHGKTYHTVSIIRLTGGETPAHLIAEELIR